MVEPLKARDTLKVSLAKKPLAGDTFRVSPAFALKNN